MLGKQFLNKESRRHASSMGYNCTWQHGAARNKYSAAGCRDNMETPNIFHLDKPELKSTPLYFI